MMTSKPGLQYPVRQIADNAGVEGAVVVGNIISENKANYGYDAQNDQYVDMVKKGIIDPVKVVRTALMDAASVAGLILTTEAAIVEAPKEAAGPAMPDMGGMGGMGGMM
jgi:chaperonin GroEL